MSGGLVKGRFIEECKHRFLCRVEVQGCEVLCYIASSSKLSPLINLTGREVFLERHLSPKRKTKYTLHSLINEESENILLNLDLVNKLLLKELNKPDSVYSGLNMYKEKRICENLKVDFMLDGESKILIEAKGIISEDIVTCFPAMVVKRAIQQLVTFKELLLEGYHVHYCLVLLNPSIERIEIDKSFVSFYQAFLDCLTNGMKIFVYKINWRNDTVSIIRDRSIENSFERT